MSSPATEMEEVFNPIAHEKQFLGELKDIRKVADSFDVVMFPIDGRVGNGYTLGGRQFIERFKSDCSFLCTSLPHIYSAKRQDSSTKSCKKGQSPL